MRQDKGFSLIELLIVVAIIGIIAAIAIPNFTSSRMAANEASAISSIRTLATAEFTYAATQGNGEFTGRGNLTGMVDSLLLAGSKSGYTFDVLTDSGPAAFTINSGPQAAGISGIRSFSCTQDGAIIANGSAIVGGK